MLTDIELTMIGMLLAGDDPDLEALRRQAATARVVSRDLTGNGFITTFAVDRDLPKASRGLILTDVMGEFSSLEYDAFFLLSACGGVASILECSIVDTAWPKDATLIRAYYVHPEGPDSQMVVETGERDLSWALRYKDLWPPTASSARRRNQSSRRAAEASGCPQPDP